MLRFVLRFLEKQPPGINGKTALRKRHSRRFCQKDFPVERTQGVCRVGAANGRPQLSVDCRSPKEASF